MKDNYQRLEYRFNNFKRAFSLLREAIEMDREKELSPLEKEGIIQRFEYTIELAWKVMKDYLESQNLIFEPLPRLVIKKSYEVNLIQDGDIWLECLDTRNKMSHTYDFGIFEETIKKIKTSYLSIFDDLYQKIFSIIEKQS